MQTAEAPLTLMKDAAAAPAFPMNRWWVAGFSWELDDKPLARTLLNRRVVFFRAAGGVAGALGDRGCHKELPLSWLAQKVRTMRVYEGPSEVHRMVIARRVLGGR